MRTSRPALGYALVIALVAPLQAATVTTIDQVVYDHCGPAYRSTGGFGAPWGAHEGLLHGVPSSYNWAAGARPGYWMNHGSNKAVTSWGQIYEWASGSPEKNIRVQLRNHRFYIYVNGAWTLAESASEDIQTTRFAEDFTKSIGPGDVRVESSANGGGISVTMTPGYNIHWWTSKWPRASLPSGYQAFFGTCELRLIPNTDQAVNLANAKYLAGVSADSYPTTTSAGSGPWPSLSISRHKFITAQWQTFTSYISGPLPATVADYRNEILSRPLPPGVTSGVTNAAPSVSAGPDLSVTLPAQAALDGTVTDDGLPSGAGLTSVWSKVSGPGTVTFGNVAAVDTTAAFSSAGTYTLRLTVSDGQLSATDTIVVTVAAAPAVPPLVRMPAGRIAVTFDGNQHDDDDIVALPMHAALLWAAGLNGRVVHVEHSNHLGNHWVTDQHDDMIASAGGSAIRFGMPSARIFDAQTQLSASIANFKSEAEKSTAADPLWFICAGPMETAWRCLNAVAADKRQYIRCISHSTWNEEHADTIQMTHTWADMKASFPTVVYYDLTDQNGSDGDNDWNTPLAKWYWLRDSAYEPYRWLYSRNQFTDKFDPSDAGMTWWLISGGPNGGDERAGWPEAKTLLDWKLANLGANAAPTVSAGPDRSITLPAQAALDGTVTDDGLPSGAGLTSVWSKVSGPGTVTFGNVAAVDTTAVFSAVGTYILRLTASDGQLSASDDVQVVVNAAVNQPPTLSFASPINGASFVQPASLSVLVEAGDADGAVANVKLYLDGTLVRQENVAPYEWGSGDAALQGLAAGSHVLRAVATDNLGASSEASITITVTSANTAPTISAIAAQTTAEDTPKVVAFTVGDAETAATSLTLARTSSNTTLLPLSGIVFGGSGANRTVTLTPAADRNGSATVTLTVQDAGGLTASRSFVLTVTAVNDAPTISAVADQVLPAYGSTGPLAVRLGDPDTDASALVLSASSSNPALVPAAGLVLGGSGADRTVAVTPTAGAAGSAVVTLTVSDGAASAQRSFTVTVAALPAGFASQDVGSPSPAGMAVGDGSSFTVSGAGADIWGQADACRFVWQSLVGDADIVVRVDALTNTNAWAKAGIMVRESTAAGSRHASLFATPGNGVAFQQRLTTGGSSSHLAGPRVAAPTWLRLSRRGTAFTASQSADGATWTVIGTRTVAIPSTALVGLAVTSHSNGTLATARFSGFRITPSASN